MARQTGNKKTRTQIRRMGVIGSNTRKGGVMSDREKEEGVRSDGEEE